MIIITIATPCKYTHCLRLPEIIYTRSHIYIYIYLLCARCTIIYRYYDIYRRAPYIVLLSRAGRRGGATLLRRSRPGWENRDFGTVSSEENSAGFPRARRGPPIFGPHKHAPYPRTSRLRRITNRRRLYHCRFFFFFSLNIQVEIRRVLHVERSKNRAISVFRITQ